MPPILNRRHALALLGAALATPAHADDPPAPAINVPPLRPGTIDGTKSYVILFSRGINAASMRDLRHQLASLVEAGVQNIQLVIDSTGGEIDPMLVTYAFIRALPVRVATHAVNWVQSAATILFLAGDDRTADRTARFLFHPRTVSFGHDLPRQQIRADTERQDETQQVYRQIYHDRTILPDDQTDRFDREQVIYNPDQALAAGIIQRIENLRIPGPDKARILFLD